MFFPNISLFGPWSGETLINGRPSVMLIALNLNIVKSGQSSFARYLKDLEVTIIKELKRAINERK